MPNGWKLYHYKGCNQQIQQMAVYLNYEITANADTVQEKGAERNHWLAKM